MHAEHVVNAGGLWAREVGRMVGLELPVLAMEHQYLITEDLPEFAGQRKELVHCIDFEGEIYMRQERGGMLLGTYERAGVPWSPQVTPWDFGQDLLPSDLDRIAPSLEVGVPAFPAARRAPASRQVVNGPFTFAPDGNPLVGPIAGLRNYWVACGVMAGFSQGGGVGLSLANWMIEGDPGADIWAMDVARYGDWATLAYTNAKVRENYSRRFRIRFPNEELPAARPLRTTPIYERLQAENAVFGDYCGLEHALWFAPRGTEAREEVTLPSLQCARARGGGMPRRARRRRHDRDLATTASSRSSGPGAVDWLARVMANRVPAVGRMALTPMLNERGRLIGDFTMCRLAEERVFLIGTYAAERYYLRWFERTRPGPGVNMRSCAMELVGLSVAGPASRALLQPLADADLSNAAFPFIDFRALRRRHGAGATSAASPSPAISATRSGSRPTTSARCTTCCWMPAARIGLRLFGGRALNSMRLEKSFGTWAREYRPIYGPFEAGLGRFVDLGKGDFIGRDRLPLEQTTRRRAPAHHARSRRHRRRRHRRRADLARRQGGRLGHLGRLRAQRRPVARARLRRPRARRRQQRLRGRAHRRAPPRAATRTTALRPAAARACAPECRP